MKKQLYLYLFIIAALMNIFTYMYFTRKKKSDEKGIISTNDGSITVTTKDSIAMLQNQLQDANYFSLEKDDNAQDYLYEQKVDYQKLIPAVKDALMDFNNDAKGNKYTDQVADGDKKFVINKIKALNHRWIIADYSNGDLWGEVLIKYFVNNDKTFEFKTIESYLFSKQVVE